nr:hypothetical protein [Pseudomonas sp. BIGb0427]
MLFDLLISKRIVLLISPSGAGKTSLIQAALLPQLRERLWPLPIIRLDSLSPPGAGESDSFNPYLSATLHSMEAGRGDERLSEGVLAQQTLASYLKLRMRDAEQAQPNGCFRCWSSTSLKSCLPWIDTTGSASRHSSSNWVNC